MLMCINLKKMLSKKDKDAIVSEEEELKQRQKLANRQIEKQLREDKKRLKNTYRFQLVGLEGSGKSVILKQMTEEEEGEENDDEEARLERTESGKRIRKNSRKAIFAAVKSANPEEMSDPHNTYRRAWILENIKEDSDDDEVYVENNDDEEGDDRDGDEDSAAEDPFVSEPLFPAYVKTLWEEQAVRRYLEERPQDLHLQSAKYFLDHKVDSMSKMSEYLPKDTDVLRLYEPTQSLMEATFRWKKVNFRLSEIKSSSSSSGSARCHNLLDPDATANIFVVDLSTIDVLMEEENKGGVGDSKLRHAMCLFKRFWRAPEVRSKPVIVLLNKVDLFEEKIRAGGIDFAQYFPEYEKYDCDAEDELDRVKEFVRECFLQLADYNHNSSNHHCYIHYTCAMDAPGLRRIMKECFEDILKREHLSMYEIL